MSDKQISAFLLIILVAFLFWAYNNKRGDSNLLGQLVDLITGKTNTSTINPATGGTVVNPDQHDNIPTISDIPPVVTGTTYNANHNPNNNGLFYTPTFNAMAFSNHGISEPIQIGQTSAIADV